MACPTMSMPRLPPPPEDCQRLPARPGRMQRTPWKGPIRPPLLRQCGGSPPHLPLDGLPRTPSCRPGDAPEERLDPGLAAAQ
eukprot:10514754-Lingulodinium_polyedra.AAC.1